MNLFSALSLLVALPFALVAAVPQPERRGACGNIDNTRNLSRLYNSTIKDHYYTANVFGELQYLVGYNYAVQTDNAALIFVSSSEATSLVPLYGLYQPATQTNLYTASASLRQTLLNVAQPPYVDSTWAGYVTGITGYVYPDGSCPGTVPLLWASNSLITDNFYTIDTAEYNSYVANGYTPMGTVAWVYPVPANRMTSIYG